MAHTSVKHCTFNEYMECVSTNNSHILASGWGWFVDIKEKDHSNSVPRYNVKKISSFKPNLTTIAETKIHLSTSKRDLSELELQLFAMDEDLELEQDRHKKKKTCKKTIYNLMGCLLGVITVMCVFGIC